MAIYEINDGRHFSNKFVDYSYETASDYLTTENNISLPLKQFLVNKIIELIKILDNESSSLSSKDVSIYTGLSGIAYCYWNVSRSPCTELSILFKTSLKKAEHLVERSLRYLKSKPGSFICDDTGPLTMAILLEMSDGDIRLISKIADFVINSSDIPNEMLYGRSGCLFALLLLRSYNKDISPEIIRNLFKSIVNSGRELSKLRGEDKCGLPPLFYEWHGKAYLGAAHGITGIMFILMQVYLMESLNSIHQSIKNDIVEFVYPTIMFLSKLRLPSGNYPSSLGESSSRDVLVHWCHGAPGWIHMFIAAYRVFKDEIFLERANEIGEVIWKRGLLEKGCGICHGSAGNGYAFLALYNCTKESKHLYRALKFAEWCTDYFQNRTRVADRPYSLFEGLAGTINFLVDCLNPDTAKFPAYEL